MGRLDKGKTTAVILRRLLAAAPQPVIKRARRGETSPTSTFCCVQPKSCISCQRIITNKSNMIPMRSNK